MKKILFILVALLYSCKTITYTDLTPTSPLKYKIVNLTPKIDESSLKGAYTMGSSEISGGSANMNIISTSFSIGTFDASSVNFTDKRKTDIITLFKKDVIENICESGEPKGSIELYISFEDEFHKREYFWAYIPLLFIPSLFGMTNFYVREELALDVYIKDKKNKIISKYSATGSGEVAIALWRGYADEIYNRKMSSGNRKANIEAYKDAMKKIKKQIENDQSFLNGQLQ